MLKFLGGGGATFIQGALSITDSRVYITVTQQPNLCIQSNFSTAYITL